MTIWQRIAGFYFNSAFFIACDKNPIEPTPKKEFNFSVDDDLSFTFSERTDTVNVITEIAEWRVSTKEKWISVSKDKKENKIYIVVETNYSNEMRSGFVQIESDNTEKKLKVSQEKFNYEKSLVPDFITDFHFSYVDDMKIEDKLQEYEEEFGTKNYAYIAYEDYHVKPIIYYTKLHFERVKNKEIESESIFILKKFDLEKALGDNIRERMDVKISHFVVQPSGMIQQLFTQKEIHIH